MILNCMKFLFNCLFILIIKQIYIFTFKPETPETVRSYEESVRKLLGINKVADNAN